MTPLLLAGWIALLAFGVLSAVGSLVSAGLAAVRRRRGNAAAIDDRILLGMRLLPALVGACAALGVVIPAFLAWEPAEGGETVGMRGLLVALVAALPVLAGAWQGLASWRLTRSLVRSWERSARKVDLGGSVPAYEIEHPSPLVTLAGIRSPRLFVARRVLAALSPAQLAAVLAHERAHQENRDNLKRLLMQAWPSWSALVGRRSRLEREWTEAAEWRADASLRQPSAVLDLAEALLVLARMTPAAAPPLLAVSSITGNGGLAARIDRLLRQAGQSTVTAAPARPALRATLALLLLAGMALSVAQVAPLRTVHGLCEMLVRLLA